MYTTTTPNKQRLKQCQRTEVVRVRLTPFEKEELAKRAASSKERTVSNYLRKRAFNLSYAIPPINEEACAELRRMSTHICQIARFAERAAKTGQIPAAHFEVLQDFSRKIAEYHLELRGKFLQEVMKEKTQSNS